MVTTSGSEERYTPYVLDSVDRQIIRVLQDDGRTSNVEIARRVGVSEPTVRKRLERLLSTGVIRITAVPDPARIGFSTVAFMTLGVELASASQIADQIAQLPEVRTIYITSGGSELLVEAWFTSSDDLLIFMAQHLGSIPGIRRMAISHVLRTIRDGSSWLLPSAPSFSNSSGQAIEPVQDTAP
jgi:Lrp/AsnC family transcriptional regulator for asnA, asnC and gidA